MEARMFSSVNGDTLWQRPLHRELTNKACALLLWTGLLLCQFFCFVVSYVFPPVLQPR